MSTTRPYIVTGKDGSERLIQANSQAQALRHAALNHFAVRAASANEVIELMSKGVKPETASQEAAAQDAATQEPQE